MLARGLLVGRITAAEELRVVEESPRRADIDLLGHLSGEQLTALYARARIFAFPSLDEGFGMPIVEAQAIGRPESGE